MAGFTLGGSSRQGAGEEGIPPESLFLYGGGSGAGSRSTEEISYTRGFELWQQQIQRHPPAAAQQHHLYASSAPGLLSFSDEPLHAGASGIGRTLSMRGGGGGSGSGSGGGGMSCQDCGNQAKKDCAHMRCRTCCKSRGFQCVTHVKSTWVPASKRRERQQELTAAAALQQQSSQRLRIGGPTSSTAAAPACGGAGGGEPSKRPREMVATRIPSAVATTSSGGGGGGGGMEAATGSFPAEVSSPAVFRCVRVSPMDDAEDEYAYQTAVSIGGHVFKGILYDQGPDSYGESSSSTAAAAITSAAAAIATTLSAPTSSATAAAAAAAASSTGLLDPSALYPTPLSAFMAGTQFFPHHPRP